jgi:hypothetical protein
LIDGSETCRAPGNATGQGRTRSPEEDAVFVNRVTLIGNVTWVIGRDGEGKIGDTLTLEGQAW